MGFLKYAKAQIVEPHLNMPKWGNKTAGKKKDLNQNLIHQASEIFKKDFNPHEHLLSHATIVCSVDTVEVPEVKTGFVLERGRKVNRKYKDYKITENCLKYINNNSDAWRRPVLMKAYKTFIGSQNYLEHVQVPELSKGRIIDAVARDIGESVYIDILVATERKHHDLIRAIEDGKISTLSMGCFLPGTKVLLADGTHKNIELLEDTDLVVTHLGNHKRVLNRQSQKWSGNVLRVQLKSSKEIFTCTPNHPFYVKDEKGEWVQKRADSFKAGDFVETPNGPEEISFIGPFHYKGWVHDIEVEDDHSYVVNQTIVHNCSIDFSTCTKCGNVAADEPNLCEHVKYERGNSFYYPDGSKGIVAELCGHETHGDNAGVQFVEASWVAIPAFGGAVLRNIVSPGEMSEAAFQRANEILKEPPKEWSREGTMQKAASLRWAQDFSFMSPDSGGDEEGGEEDKEEEDKKETEKEPFAEVEQEIYDEVVTRVKKKLKDQVRKRDLDKQLTPEMSTLEPNDNIIKQAAYNNGVDALIKTAKNDAELLNKVAVYNENQGIKVSTDLYRAALMLGSYKNYRTLNSFVKTAASFLSHTPDEKEIIKILKLSKLIEKFNKE